MPAMDYTRLHYGMVILLALIYGLLFVLEHIWPLRKPSRPLASRIFINLFFTVLVYGVASLFIAPVAQFTLQWSTAHHVGLLSQFSLNDSTLFISGFLCMDLTFYYWHRLNHEMPVLWRFHNVHHTDPDLDVTTSMRFHLVEIAYSLAFRLLQLGVIGINPVTFLCYEMVFQANTFFQHSNVKLPIRLERIVNIFIVTPRMHGIHHSDYQQETHRNYGVVFSFWDRLHGTIKLNIPQQSIVIGVPGYARPLDNRVLNALLMPFKKQRHYWKTDRINRALKQSGKPGNRLCE